MKVNRRKFAPIAAAVLLAVGSLVLILLDEENSYEFDHLRRQLLAEPSVPLTEDQIKLQDSLVCSKHENEVEQSSSDVDDEDEELPEQSKPTTIFMGTEPSVPYDGCFISAIFGISSSLSDKPLEITTELQAAYPNYAFIMFTNLVDLNAQGWQTFLYFDGDKKRMITLSRYPKFLGWKEEFVRRNCPVVFYLDGAQKPRGSLNQFTKEKRNILKTKEGFVQQIHKPLESEMSDIVRYNKDTQAHMDATLAWMQEQPDFELWEEPRRVYSNCHIAYNPNSPDFQKATQYFWNIYANEQLSWRDQPLWAYTLFHFNIKPKSFPTKRLFKADHSRFGGRKGGHKYDSDTEGEVERFVSSVCNNNREEEKKDVIVLEGVGMKNSTVVA